MTRDKHLGSISELTASAWLLKQGYEVFRNVSQHGYADIIALKDGQIHILDVKTLGSNTACKITMEQYNKGVRPLHVDRMTGNCHIDEKCAYLFEMKRVCNYCGKDFLMRKKKGAGAKYCSRTCKKSVAIRLSTLRRQIRLAIQSKLNGQP